MIPDRYFLFLILVFLTDSKGINLTVQIICYLDNTDPDPVQPDTFYSTVSQPGRHKQIISSTTKATNHITSMGLENVPLPDEPFRQNSTAHYQQCSRPWETKATPITITTSKAVQPWAPCPAKGENVWASREKVLHPASFFRALRLVLSCRSEPF